MPDPSDLPKDLTFKDPAISARPANLVINHEPRPEPISTPLQKLRDLVIGLLLLGGFFLALWGLSKLLISPR